MLSKDKDTDKNTVDSLKDTKNISASYKPEGFRLESVMLSYNKTHKLITALYMVTDIIDKEEPIRNKLRTLGLEILSDIHNIQKERTALAVSIDEIMSFLNIASAMNFISNMNCAILQKEFFELQKSIKESIQAKPIWLEEFLKDSSLEGWSQTGVDTPHPSPLLVKERGNSNPKGHLEYARGKHIRIGVQKGHTLMKAIKDMHALSGVEVSDRITEVGRQEFGRPTSVGSKAYDFDILKKQRRDNIIKIIKAIGGSATIKDIKDKVREIPEQVGILVSCSEKTLQRELVSMIKDDVLNKTGEKRWSRYFLK